MKMRVCLSVAVLVLVGASALYGAGPDNPWVGVLWTKGAVSVGDAKVSSGTTVLPGDVITTAPGASAWVRFRSPASTILLADTQVTLLASDSPSLLLHHGTVVVDQQVVDPVSVALANGFVLVKGDPGTGAECEMASVGNSATVTVRRGTAEIHAQGAPVTLHPGQSARVEANPGGTDQVAGKINRVIPQGQIQREGTVQELPLQLNQVINWNDLVKTLEAGRAQITLLDGSTLNVGARSQIKVIKHDPQAQQTDIELTFGKLEANVQKITAPGGKFQLHTKSAVIGTIDTAFVVAVQENGGTEVCGVDGTTVVGSSDPNITQTVVLHKGECTFVPLGGAPTTPVADAGQLANLLGQTIIGGGGAAPAGLFGLSHKALLALGITVGAGTAVAITGIVLATGGASTNTRP